MLREVRDARFARRLSPLGWRYFVVQGETPTTTTWGRRRHRALTAAQTQEPVALYESGGRTHWLFEGRFHWSDDDLTACDVLALVRERERRRRRRLDRAHAALAGEVSGVASPRREPIPRAVRLAVWERDGGRCVECGSAFDLQYDHVVPVALGGAGTVENLQVLCAPCNQAKGASVA